MDGGSAGVVCLILVGPCLLSPLFPDSWAGTLRTLADRLAHHEKGRALPVEPVNRRDQPTPASPVSVEITHQSPCLGISATGVSCR